MVKFCFLWKGGGRGGVGVLECQDLGFQGLTVPEVCRFWS